MQSLLHIGKPISARSSTGRCDTPHDSMLNVELYACALLLKVKSYLMWELGTIGILRDEARRVLLEGKNYVLDFSERHTR